MPLRYNETSTLFRNEASGEMHGLIRLRQFTISEGHLACTPEQLEGEFAGCLELAKYMLTTLGLEEDVFYRFSKWDKNDRQKYIGSEEAWEAAQDTMRRILNDLHIDYYEADGEAAFYGPKLGHPDQERPRQGGHAHHHPDRLSACRKVRNGIRRPRQQAQVPYVIHRTSIGCYERTLALLIEKYAGAFPLWLAPEQARVILISDDRKPYAEEVLRTLKDAGLRASLDDRNEKLGFKIREAQLEKLPYMLIVGGKEAENGTVGVRSRKEGDLGAITPGAFIEKAAEEIRTKAR
ncbi:MAG: aminoacyl--tRNA ligase-related protein [Acutalibacteraceae bacterium]